MLLADWNDKTYPFHLLQIIEDFHVVWVVAGLGVLVARVKRVFVLRTRKAGSDVASKNQLGELPCSLLLSGLPQTPLLRPVGLGDILTFYTTFAGDDRNGTTSHPT